MATPTPEELGAQLKEIGITRKTAGQPLKLPDVKEELLSLITAGVHPNLAAQEVGITVRTFYYWQQYGRNAAALMADGEELTDHECEYLQFLHDVTRAKNRLQTRMERELGKKISDLRGSELLDALGRIDPARWGRKDKLNVHHTSDTMGSQVMMTQYAQAFAFALRSTLEGMDITDQERIDAGAAFQSHLDRLTTPGSEQGLIDA